MMTEFSPALGGTPESPDLAPALGGKAIDPTGMVEHLRAWVFRREKQYSNMGVGYLVERVVCELNAAIEAGEWSSMLDETFDNGERVYGADWGDGYTLDHAQWVPRTTARYVVRLLPAWLKDDLAAELWTRAGGEAREWIEHFPRLTQAPSAEVMFHLIDFLNTKPRKEERKKLKADLFAWLNGDADYPREATWMTKPYDPYRR